MRIRPWALAIGGVWIGLAIGCSSKDRVAAIVNGHLLTVRDVEERWNRLTPAVKNSIGNDRRQVVEQMVNEMLLLQEASRRGLDRDAQVRRLLQEARHQIMIGRLLERIREETAGSVSEESISSFYQSNRASFAQPQSWRASHILAADLATAEKALERVKNGESFAQVAQGLSTDPSKARGGDIGFFAKGQVIPEFESACRDLKPGEVSKVVKSSLGYHVIQLTEYRPARERTLEESRDPIRQLLQNQQAQQKVESFLQQLRAKSQVKIRELPAPSAAAGPGPDAAACSNPSL